METNLLPYQDRSQPVEPRVQDLVSRMTLDEKIAFWREVMRYAGPRMVYRHPILALFHLLDGFRQRKLS